MSVAEPTGTGMPDCCRLLEAARTQQRLIASSLRQLREHTQGLDGVVRGQVRRTLIEELAAVSEESARAVQALRTLERRARLRFIGWSLASTVLSAAVTAVAVGWLLPSRAQITAMRAERAQLAAALQLLRQQGGRIDLRRCGVAQRWCVRIDAQAPGFGEHGEYRVIGGY
jgi:hypothetical protein